MKIIAGLGNPGTKYETTRHNVGFIVADLLAEALEVEIEEHAFGGLCARTRYNGEQIILVKPQTFMNLSGECVGRLADYFKVENEEVLVISDDKDTPVGTLKLKKKGSSGGHNGLKSLIEHLGGDDFPRLKVGIGSGAHGAIDHVLGRFTDEEWEILTPVLEAARDAALCWLQEGPEVAMNRYNRRPPKPEPEPKPEPAAATPDSEDMPDHEE